MLQFHRTSLLLAPLTLMVVACSAEAQRATFPRNNSGGELLPEEACYDVQHYTLRLAVDPDERSIAGRLRMDALLVGESDRIVVDLDTALDVREAQFIREGQSASPASVQRTGDRISIALPELELGAEFSLELAYGGQPRIAPNPPWRGGFTWTKTRSGSPWVATSCQGEGADLWWPCKDHPSDEALGMDLFISVPDPLVVASNGRLESVEPSDREGWSTHHWRVTTPINNYGVALNIAPYETITGEFESVAGDTFDFTYWVLPENVEKGEAIFDEFQEHMRFFEEFCGPYPFRGDKYGVVETPHLGMEHQSIIAYGNRYRGDANFEYDWLHHHELAHEWWANLVTARDWKDFWIHEGIGTYMQPLYLEWKFGTDAYFRKMRLDRRRVSNRGAVAPRGNKPTDWMYFAKTGSESPGDDIYFKGSWVCHALRWLLEDETFFKVLRRWAYPDPELEAATDGSACRLTDTTELVEIAESVSEQTLDWFFDTYLRQAKLPVLQTEVTDGLLELRWESAIPGDFPMPVPVQVGDKVVRVDCPGGVGSLEVGDEEFEIDPLGWLFADVRS